MAGNVESRSRNLVISLCRKAVVHIYLWRKCSVQLCRILPDNCLNTATTIFSHFLLYLTHRKTQELLYILKLNHDKFNKYDLDRNFPRREIDGLMQNIMRLKAKEISKSYKKEEEINPDCENLLIDCCMIKRRLFQTSFFTRNNVITILIIKFCKSCKLKLTIMYYINPNIDLITWLMK